MTDFEIKTSAQPAPTISKEDLVWAIAIDDDNTLTYGDVHEIIHRDIAIGNDYRKERIKLLTGLSTGVFALTVTFHKDLFGGVSDATGIGLMLCGWAALLISVLSGIQHFRKWEDFYLEHRKVGLAVWHYRIREEGADKEAAARDFQQGRERIDSLRQEYGVWNFLQSWALLIGLALIAGYVCYTSILLVNHPERRPAPEHAASERVVQSK
jgi:hypothetical protein